MNTSSSAPLLNITSDVLNNALLLHGSQETITKAKQLLTLWDQPYPQIRIEAFIFETTETYAREIGNELEARGIAAGAEGSKHDKWWCIYGIYDWRPTRNNQSLSDQ